MNRTFISLVLPIILAVTLSAEQKPSGDGGERSVYWKPGVPLSALALPGDRTVIVERAGSHPPPFHVGPPLTIADEIRQLDASDAIVVVRITQVEPQLTPSLDWIRTRVRGVIVEPVKIPTWPTLESKGQAEFEFDGGELRFNDTAIKAGSYPILRVGSTYLVTLVADRLGNWRFSRHFLVDGNGKLVAPEQFDPRNGKFASPLVGLERAEVAKKLKQR